MMMRSSEKGHTYEVVERRVERDQISAVLVKQVRSVITDGVG